MRALLDANALIWSITEPERLRPQAREVIASPENELAVSLATLWEIGLKASRGRLDLRHGFEGFLQRVRELQTMFLQVGIEDIVRSAALPFHHRDPFDRMLIAQALAEGIPIVTSDRRFAAYGVEVVW